MRTRGRLSAAERARGSILGGAVGDALGAPVEFMGIDEIRRRFGHCGVVGMVDNDRPVGAIGDETQLSLFTMEALIRGFQQSADDGGCSRSRVARYAYWRWLDTQGVAPMGIDESTFLDGWLVDEPAMRFRRSPSLGCLSALELGISSFGSTPVNHCPGPAPLGRIAPVGLVVDDPLQLGAENAALTHGHPDARWATGAFTLVIRSLADGEQLEDAVEATLRAIELIPEADHVARLIRQALRLASAGPTTLEAIEELGNGWTAAEALAIALYCVLSAGGPLEAMRAAVNNGGASDVLGALCGNLLGAGLGDDWIPGAWIDVLDARPVIEELLADFTSRCIVGVDVDRRRYPGVDMAKIDHRPVHRTV